MVQLNKKSSILIFNIVALLCALQLTSCQQNEQPTDQKQNSKEEKTSKDQVFDRPPPPRTYTTPLGITIRLPEPKETLLENFEKAKTTYENNPNDADNIIWYGRRAGYLSRYQEAINIFSKGIEKFPSDDRFYRHRGHRHISARAYTKAVLDLTKAADLIQGKENEMEPDGAPNAQNTPVSSRQGNIWYHLGLAYYLKGNMSQAFDAFQNCLQSTNNDDNIVSATHWLYMIQRRMGNEQKATETLKPIHNDMKIIENHAYYHLCKFYKGLINQKELAADHGGAQNAATQYGLANWHFYNGDKEKAKQLLDEIIDGQSWNSFGYIAAERDIISEYNVR